MVSYAPHLHLCLSGLSIKKADGSKQDSRYRILDPPWREHCYRNYGGTFDLFHMRTPLWAPDTIISLLISLLASSVRATRAPRRWAPRPKPDHGAGRHRQESSVSPKLLPTQGPVFEVQTKNQLPPREPSTGPARPRNRLVMCFVGR